MSPSPYYNLFDSRGNPVSLGKKVGSGGEGDVYEIAPHRRDVLAKIYHKPLTGERQEKLRLMVSGCNDELKEFAAWPLDLLHDSKNGPVCGFVMPRITDCEPIHKVYGPSHRKASFPNADWKFLVRTAKNLAAAFYIIHKYGYVVGDVNEGNILVTKKACVRLIDCDSFQVQAREKIYFCEVGVAQFTPPELQKSKDFRMLRTQNHDNFGLAILIFLLLFMGRHPFSGVYKGNDDMPIERAIAEHRFAFGRGAALKAMAPPPNSVGLSVVPREVSSLFEQAFTESGHQSWGRPSANDWWNVLDALEKRLKKCPTESMHTFYTGLATCPWCGLENSSGILLFLSSDTISRIDVASEWQKVLAIKPPGPIPEISPRKYRCLPAPFSLDIARAVRLGKVRQAVQIVLLVASAAIMLVLSAGSGFPHPIDAIGLVPAGIAGLLFVLPGRDMMEKKRRKKEFEDARYQLAALGEKMESRGRGRGIHHPAECAHGVQKAIRGDRAGIQERARCPPAHFTGAPAEEISGDPLYRYLHLTPAQREQEGRAPVIWHRDCGRYRPAQDLEYPGFRYRTDKRSGELEKTAGEQVCL